MKLKILTVILAAVFLVTSSPAQGLRNVIPNNQKPIMNVFPPAVGEQSKPGDGKFVIFTREKVGKDWDFIAGAWECIPSRPDKPITKRVEFCHSSWNGEPLLDNNDPIDNASAGRYPRFVRLQVDNDNRDYSVNLYDINYKTWDVRCIWQGSQLFGFGVMGDSIFCRSSDGWRLLNGDSGKLSMETPFAPMETDGDFWLVRKPDETEGCWSYDRKRRAYVAHFVRADFPGDLKESKLSPDGKSRAWVLVSAPRGWHGGSLAGQLILQRNGEEEDVSVPIDIQAFAGSGIRVIPYGVQLTFSPEGKLQLRASKGADETEDRVWSIDIATGKVSAGVAPHSEPAQDEATVLGGVPVPDYLRKYIREFSHFGRNGLAPAFLLHLGILKVQPEYGDGAAGVSPDGRHVLYRAAKGPLAGVYIYGDLLTKQTVRWESPAELDGNAQELVWVETPD